MLATSRPTALAFALLLAVPAWAGLGGWTPIGPEGAEVRSIAFDPLDPEVVYVGVRRGGLYRSTDGGATFASLTTGNLAVQTIGAIAVDPASSSTLYVGVDEGSPYGGLFKTTTGGTSWTQIGAVGDFDNIGSIAVVPVSPRVLYVGDATGSVVRVVDNGATQTFSSTGLGNGYLGAIAIDPTNSAIAYAASANEGAVLKTTNTGMSWAPNSTGMSMFQRSSHGLAIDPSAPSRVFSANTGGVYRSTNGGLSWTLLTNGIASGSFEQFRAVAIDPGSSSLMYAGHAAGTLYVSTDAGAGWAVTTSSLGSIYVLAPSSADGGPVFAGTELGLHKGHDAGRVWTFTSAGLQHLDALSIAIHPSAPDRFFVGTPTGLYEGLDGGARWRRFPTFYPSPMPVRAIVVNPTNPQRIFAATDDGVRYTTNGGTTWADPATPATFPQTSSIAIDDTNPSVLLATLPVGGIVRSSDQGVTWSTRYNAFSGSTSYNQVIFNPGDPQIAWGCVRALGVLRSTNNGTTWSALGGANQGQCTSIAVEPIPNGTLYAATYNNGIYRSINSGGSWQQVNTGLPTTMALYVAVDPLTPGTVYAVVDGGVFMSHNSGTAWSELTGLSARAVHTLTIDRTTPRRVYATTRHGGVQVWEYYPDSGVVYDAGVDAGPPDAGAADAGAGDGGAGDAGGADAGSADAGAPDAGTADAGSFDAGVADGGDAGAADGGAPDAGVADAGADAGEEDAGAQDAGEADSGTPDAGDADAGHDAGSVDAGDTQDAGSSSPDGGGTNVAPSGCGCASAPPGALLWLVLALATTLRRRRWSPARRGEAAR